MTVTAYGGGRVIRKWRGQVYWTGAISDDGDAYVGYVGARRQIRWLEGEADPVRVETDRHGRGGVPLRSWLPESATRVTVLVQHGYGAGTGARNGNGTEAGLAARGSDGYVVVTDAGEELSRNGGRPPQPGGVEGGSAGGHGEPGDQGLSIGIGLWGVISVPASLIPLLETTSLLADAGVSPTALARKWLDRALRVTGDRLKREIASHAAEVAARPGQVARAKLSRRDDYARLTAAEQSRIIDAMTDAFQREYFEKLERSAADEMARLERGLADHAARPPRPGSPEAYVERLMREDLGAAERVQLAARQARADFRPRVRPPLARGRAFPSRRAAFRAARRDLGIPAHQLPDQVRLVPMTDQQGRAILDADGRRIMTREYTYTRPDGARVIIQEHSAGHRFPDGGTQGPHFNVRPAEDPRNGIVSGTRELYSF